jgi:ketosteroid isomerase-like protein
MRTRREEAMQDQFTKPLTHAAAVRLAERYVGAYNERDLDAMLAVQDENVVSYPAPIFGRLPHTGHAGVREWWGVMVASGRWYDVVVNEVRVLGPDRCAFLGEIHDRGELVSPWGVVVRVRDGLIVESRSYLSDTALLESLRVLGEPSTAS